VNLPTGAAGMSKIYQLKVSLMDSKPPIWRRLQVPADITLDRLHRVIQVAMGWTDTHLHQFVAGDTTYGVPHPDYDFGVVDERRVKLSRVARGEKARLRYDYDFGDDWRHQLLVEKVLPAEPGVRYPRCLAGKRHCPPEDCGGVWGYADFVEAVRDPGHPDHQEMLEWAGGEFDPEAFDVEETNRALDEEG
jgi:hypothetical protein